MSMTMREIRGLTNDQLLAAIKERAAKRDSGKPFDWNASMELATLESEANNRGLRY